MTLKGKHPARVDVPRCPCCGYSMVEDGQSVVYAGLRFVVQDLHVFVYRDAGQLYPSVLQRLPFTRAEAVLLMTLAMFQGRVVSKQALYDHCYPNEEPDPKIIDVFICKIRVKLRKLDLPLEVLTDWGRGYVLAPVVKAEAA